MFWLHVAGLHNDGNIPRAFEHFVCVKLQGQRSSVCICTSAIMYALTEDIVCERGARNHQRMWRFDQRRPVSRLADFVDISCSSGESVILEAWSLGEGKREGGAFFFRRAKRSSDFTQKK